MQNPSKNRYTTIIGSKFKIGKHSEYSDFCWFNAKFGIEIGDYVLIGPFTIIQSSTHIIKNIKIDQNNPTKSGWTKGNRDLRITGEKIIIGNDVWIGGNCFILPGVTIPNKCVIGAGTILTKSMSKKLNEGDIVCNETKLRILGSRKDYED